MGNLRECCGGVSTFSFEEQKCSSFSEMSDASFFTLHCPSTEQLQAKYPEILPKNLKKRKKPLKRPPCSFMLFCKVFRAKLQREFPKLSNTQITQLLATMWKKTQPHEREHYRFLAEQEKAKFQNTNSSNSENKISLEKRPKKRQKLANAVVESSNSVTMPDLSQNTGISKPAISQLHEHLCLTNLALNTLSSLSVSSFTLFSFSQHS